MNATTLTSTTPQAAAISATRLDYAALLLRASLGTMFLAHGLMKFIDFTLPGTAAFFESVGFPGWTAYIVSPAEVLAGVALIAGFRTRLVALLTLPILLGAIVPHAGAGWAFSNAGGGWEYPVFLVTTAVVVAVLGGGRLAVSRPHADPSHASTPPPPSAAAPAAAPSRNHPKTPASVRLHGMP